MNNTSQTLRMQQYIALTGFYFAMAAFLATIGYGVAQVFQVAGLVHYPLADRLIYGFSLAIAPSFLLAMLAFYYLLPCTRPRLQRGCQGMAFATPLITRAVSSGSS